VLPLLWFTTRPAYLRSHAFSMPAALGLWAVAALIITINFWMLYRLAP